MGNIDNFFIQYGTSNAVFFAGKSLSGNVVIKLSKPLKVKSITVQILGRAHVHWRETKSSGKTNRNIDYKAEEIYISQRFVLVKSDVPGQDRFLIPTGVSKYSFSYPLASSLPNSFEGTYGYVRYLIRAVLERPWKFDRVCKSAFTVLCQFDLNAYSRQLRVPLIGSDERNMMRMCCIKDGQLHIDFCVDKQGYVPGEALSLEGSVSNETSCSSEPGAVLLLQVTEFWGAAQTAFSSGRRKAKVKETEVARLTFPKVASGSVFRFRRQRLVIPPLPPSHLEGCQCINITYIIKMQLATGLLSNDLHIVGKLVIGTVPLRCESQASSSGAPGSTHSSGSGVVDVPPDYNSLSAATLPVRSDEPPPSYEQCVLGRGVNIYSEDDHEFGISSSSNHQLHSSSRDVNAQRLNLSLNNSAINKSQCFYAPVYTYFDYGYGSSGTGTISGTS